MLINMIVQGEIQARFAFALCPAQKAILVVCVVGSYFAAHVYSQKNLDLQDLPPGRS